MKITDAMINPFKVPEVKKRILFTMGMLLVYRFGSFVPTPGIDGKALGEFFERMMQQGTVVGLLDMFTGGALTRFSVLSLGIMPYISASIIMSLLTSVIPTLEQINKEGETGRKKITQYTRYLALAIGIIQALGICVWMESMTTPGGARVVLEPGLGFRIMTILTLTTGTIFVMWLAEQITEKGIGNGSSLIIFISIVSGIPGGAWNSLNLMLNGQLSIFKLFFILLIIILVTAGVVILIQGHRKISVQYARRVVGRKVYGGQSTYLPLQVNMAGVIPIIFASSILVVPAMLGTFFAGKFAFFEIIASEFSTGGIIYGILDVAAIMFFTYFYTSIIFNPVDVADNMRKAGGFIPGIRPGKPTANHIEKILHRILFVGAVSLAIVDIIPMILVNSFNMPFYFGGTSVLIMVGVALDTLRQIESHLLMRHYEGFIKKGRIQGRI